MWLFVAAFITFAILAAIFRDAILLYIDPHRDAILSTPFSWLAPVAVLIAVEFPPLAGHSATAVATGAIWGFKLGVLIVFAGTLVGEILCFGAFSTFLRDKAERCVEASFVLFLSLVDSPWSVRLMRTTETFAESSRRSRCTRSWRVQCAAPASLSALRPLPLLESESRAACRA